MKTMLWKTCLALCACGLLLSANAQTAPAKPDAPATPPPDMPAEAPPPQEIGDATAPPAPDNAATPTSPAANTPAPADKSPAADAAAAVNIPETFTPTTETPGTNALRLNFRNAPLELVLNYLSDAAGFIIVLDTQVRGTVSVISSHTMTQDEAVDLLNAALNKNGYAAIRDGRTLTIISKNDAKTRNIPVKIGNKPGDIPKNEEIVTQIIPIRYVEAKQLMTDLSSFVSPQAIVVANEAGNSIVITDTQSNIRHLTEIIQAIDNSAEGETEIRVFRLKHANPADVASELTGIFPGGSSSAGGQSQSPFRFGGGGGSGGGAQGGFFGRMAAAAASTGGSQNTRIQKQTQVTAVADARTSSVIVTASKDLMQEIAGMMDQLDVPSTRDQKVFVFHMNNADPQQAAQVLQSMFQTTTSTRGSSSSGSSSQNSALMVRQQNNASSSSSSTSASTTGTALGASRSRTGGNSSF